MNNGEKNNKNQTLLIQKRKEEEMKNNKNEIYNIEQKNINNYIKTHKNNMINKIYQNKRDIYPYSFGENGPKRIPHETLRKNSKKRVIDNLINAMILPFEEQRFMIENPNLFNNNDNLNQENENKNNFTFRDVTLGPKKINVKFDKNDLKENRQFKINKNIIKDKNKNESSERKMCKSKEEFLNNINYNNKSTYVYKNLNKDNIDLNKNIIKKSQLNTIENICSNQDENSKEYILNKRKEDWKKLFEYFKKK